MYFQILLDQWQGVILEIPYWCFGVFSPFLPNKQPRVVFFKSDLKFDPLNLYPVHGDIVRINLIDT